MFSCKKATELLDKRIFEKLSPAEKIKLFLHTKMCNACNAYQKQTTLIHKALNKQIPTTISPSDVTSLKEKIKQKIPE